MQHTNDSMKVNQSIYCANDAIFLNKKESLAITCLVGIEFANRLTASNLIFWLRNHNQHKRRRE